MFTYIFIAIYFYLYMRYMYSVLTEMWWFSHGVLSDACDPLVHGILQAGILEWVAISFSRGSSQLRN